MLIVGQEGVEPSASLGLNERGLPIAYRPMLQDKCRQVMLVSMAPMWPHGLVTMMRIELTVDVDPTAFLRVVRAGIEPAKSSGSRPDRFAKVCVPDRSSETSGRRDNGTFRFALFRSDVIPTAFSLVETEGIEPPLYRCFKPTLYR